MGEEGLRGEGEPGCEGKRGVSGDGSWGGEDETGDVCGVAGGVLVGEVGAKGMAAESENGETEDRKPLAERGEEEVDGVFRVVTLENGAGGSAPAGKIRDVDGGVAEVEEVIEVAEEEGGGHAVAVEKDEGLAAVVGGGEACGGDTGD